jgi:hypothetical protein
MAGLKWNTGKLYYSTVDGRTRLPTQRFGQMNVPEFTVNFSPPHPGLSFFSNYKLLITYAYAYANSLCLKERPRSLAYHYHSAAVD